MNYCFQYRNLLLLITLISTLTACEIINPEEEIPSYIHIESIQLNITDANIQGSSSHKITDAWVYIDDNIVGAFELPATFPVLYAGKHSIKVRGGIMKNGIAASRVAYPLFDLYDTTVTLIREEIHTINSTIEYYSSLKFQWVEDFEGSGVTLDTTSYSDTTITRIITDSLVFEGKGSGVIYLDSNHPTFWAKTTMSYNLPQSGTPVYLEMDYKTTVRLEMGIIAHLPSGISTEFVAGVFPIGEWNKIYIDLTDYVSSSIGAKTFEIYFYAKLDKYNNEGKIYLDNIKLVNS